MRAETASAVAANAVHKGDVLAAARYAGVQAAKDTPSYLPLCDPVLVSNVTVLFSIGDTAIDIEASADSPGGANVELHALTAVTVAALTVYDMCKSADRTMVIGPVSLA